CSCSWLAHVLLLVRTGAAQPYLLLWVLSVAGDGNCAQVLDQRMPEAVRDERAEALAVRLVLVLQ
ncbi:hypothetical protein PMAYCL1PPCAC_27375, partial [Pristionchus mayeri]